MKAGRLAGALLVNFRLCLLEIFSNKTRSFITTFGIFLSVVSLLVNFAFLRAMQDNIMTSLREIGGLDILTVNKNDPQTPQGKRTFQRSPGLTLADGEYLVRQVPSIRKMIIQRDLGWVRLQPHIGGRVRAASADYLDIYDYQVETGRPLSAADHQNGAFVCLVGSRVVERLFGKDADPLGKTIRVRNSTFTVVGTIHTENKFSERGMEVVIPYSAYAGRYVSKFEKVADLTFLLTSSDRADEARRQITVLLRALHRDIPDFEVSANTDKLEEMQLAATGMQVLLICIAAITLLVGAISIMNIMFATIGDRIREIGVRKALGAQNSDIFLQFLIEAVLLCVVGGLPGMVLGTAITLVPKGTMPFNPQLAPQDYLVTLVFVIGAGLASGLFPSLKAARMQPVDALRY